MLSKKHVGGVVAALVAVAAFLPASPSRAEMVEYVSATGAGTTCSASQPCANISTAFVTAGVDLNNNSARVICLNGSVANGDAYSVYSSNITLDVDCPQGFMSQLYITNEAGNVSTRLQHIGFRYGGTSSEIVVQGNGTLILENCVFTDSTATALDIEPNGTLNLVIRNSRISNAAGGILLKPAVGGRINATLDHVTIADNTAGGLKIDTTNGPVTVDITDSVISNNGANGINAVAGANQNMVSIKNSVIAKNGIDGVVANGANAAVLLQTTLLDQNAAGATLVASGGHISTYGNNSIVGSAGSGFTGPAPLQ